MSKYIVIQFLFLFTLVNTMNGQVVDIDGNVYNTAPMGFQKQRGSYSGPASEMKNTPWVGENIIWMTSNLNVSKFKNGEPTYSLRDFE